MKIIGINDSYNASAAVIADGKLIAAVQEDRLSRVRNERGFPDRAVAEVLKIAGFDISEIDVFAFAGEEISDKTGFFDADNSSIVDKNSRMDKLLTMGVDRSRIKFFSRHLCYSATAYYGYKTKEEVLALSCDSGGDGLCGTVNLCKDGKIETIAQIQMRESVAVVYSMITEAMGFLPFCEEFKIMGLGPYCRNSEISREICSKISDLFKFNSDNPMLWQRKEVDLRAYLAEIIKFKRFDDIAGAVQAFTEDFFCKWVQNCIKTTGISKVALAGSAFMNVKVNKAIQQLKDVQELFIFPSCSDETLAVGAAYLASKDVNKPVEGFYFGAEFDDCEIKRAVTDYKFKNNVKIEYFEDIEKKVAEILADGEVVARFKGRAEFGARALGNRSILARADNADIVREINSMIKMRDFWMPFAPSMLEDDAREALEGFDSLSSCYMIKAFGVKNQWVKDMIAALHPADATARVQVVKEQHNQSYYQLLKYYKELTSRGVILNTSFNIHGSVMVYKPVEAVDVFDRSGLGYLAIGNYLLTKDTGKDG